MPKSDTSWVDPRVQSVCQHELSLNQTDSDLESLFLQMSWLESFGRYIWWRAAPAQLCAHSTEY